MSGTTPPGRIPQSDTVVEPHEDELSAWIPHARTLEDSPRQRHWTELPRWRGVTSSDVRDQGQIRIQADCRRGLNDPFLSKFGQRTRVCLVVDTASSQQLAAEVVENFFVF